MADEVKEEQSEKKTEKTETTEKVVEEKKEPVQKEEPQKKQEEAPEEKKVEKKAPAKEPKQKKQSSSPKETTEEHGFDASQTFKKVGAYLKANNKVALALIVLIFLMYPLWLGYDLRVSTAELPALENQARNAVYSQIQSQLEQQINSQYPNLAQARKDEIIQEELAKTLSEGEELLENQVQQTAQVYKSYFQDDTGQTYLMAIDPFFWYRLTRNYVNNGFEKDIEVDGAYVDTKILAGLPIEDRSHTTDKVSNLQVFAGAFLFNVWSMFDSSVTLMKALFFLPALLGTLAIIPAFFLGKRIGGNTGGFFAALIIAIHPSFLARTIGGFADTDAYTVFFPLLIIWFLLWSFDLKKKSQVLTLAGLAGLTTGLFAFAWAGWWYVFDFILVMAVVKLLYLTARHYMKNKDLKQAVMNEDNKITLYSLGMYVVVAGIFVSLFESLSVFTSAFTNAFQFTQIKAVGLTKIWPNVLTTVAELNPSSLISTLSQVSLGSAVLLFIGVLGVFLSMIKKGVFQRKELLFVTGSFIVVFALAFTKVGDDLTNFKNLFILALSAAPFAYAVYKKLGPAALLTIGSFSYYFILTTLRSHVNNPVIFTIFLSIPILIGVFIALKHDIDFDIKYAVILLIWFGGTTYASTKGVRFVQLFVPAFAIAVGVGLGVLAALIYHSFREVVSKEDTLPLKTISKVVITVLLLVLLFIPALGSAKATVSGQTPGMNDGWYTLLTKIKASSEPDAIINSWWDFGHWFEAIAERATTLDGGRQNSPQAHWLGKLMLTDSERESVGILRMLDCGATKSYDVLLEHVDDDQLKAITTLNEVIVNERAEATTILTDAGLSQEEAEEVLLYTHCEPPENFLITSEDMIRKSSVWAHFGGWNFTKAYQYNQIYNKKSESEAVAWLKENFGHNESLARTTFTQIQTVDPDQWISPWPGYQNDLRACQGPVNDIVSCRDSVIFNVTSQDAWFVTPDGWQHPKSVVYLDNQGEFVEKKYGEDILQFQGNDISIGIVQKNGRYSSVVMQSELAASMFTRLYYFEGTGLRYFDLFDHSTSGGFTIYTWKVDWQGTDAITHTPPPQPVVEEPPVVEEEPRNDSSEPVGEVSPENETANGTN